MQWITPTGIAPPREHLELGDRVSYHHRACVARRVKPVWADRPFWTPVGPGRLEWWGALFGEEKPDPLARLPLSGPLNKTVVVWPEEGSGVLVAMIRRGIGESVRGTSGYSSPMGDSEPEPGYFTTDEWVWLYAVKHSLARLDFVLAPIWATRRG